MFNFNTVKNRRFGNFIVDVDHDAYPLDGVVEWISQNLYPEEVFYKKDLEDWALTNGFVREED